MKQILIIISLVLLSVSSNAQDIITMTNGNRVNAIVREITPTLVRYNLHSEPNGKVIFAYKDMVSSILYQTGKIETFTQSEVRTTESKSSTNENQNYYQNQNQNQQSGSNLLNKENRKITGGKKRSGFSQVHVGLALPIGKFAEGKSKNFEDYEYAADFIPKGNGFATMGFNVGYKYFNPLSVENLSLVLGVEAYYNGLN